jgi:hypothetical protein
MHCTFATCNTYGYIISISTIQDIDTVTHYCNYRYIHIYAVYTRPHTVFIFIQHGHFDPIVYTPEYLPPHTQHHWNLQTLQVMWLQPPSRWVRAPQPPNDFGHDFELASSQILFWTNSLASLHDSQILPPDNSSWSFSFTSMWTSSSAHLSWWGSTTRVWRFSSTPHSRQKLKLQSAHAAERQRLAFISPLVMKPPLEHMEHHFQSPIVTSAFSKLCRSALAVTSPRPNRCTCSGVSNTEQQAAFISCTPQSPSTWAVIHPSSIPMHERCPHWGKWMKSLQLSQHIIAGSIHTLHISLKTCASYSGMPNKTLTNSRSPKWRANWSGESGRSLCVEGVLTSSPWYQIFSNEEVSHSV